MEYTITRAKYGKTKIFYTRSHGTRPRREFHLVSLCRVVYSVGSYYRFNFFGTSIAFGFRPNKGNRN